MGISVVLQDERCNEISRAVHDPDGVIALCLPDLADATYSCLRFIDPYGDTIFNRAQATVMIEEWDRLKHSFSERNAETLWADIRELIVRCSEETHVYLKFMGD
jgi:hypothetical protein